MPNSDDFLIVTKTLVAKGQNSCSGVNPPYSFIKVPYQINQAWEVHETKSGLGIPLNALLAF